MRGRRVEALMEDKDDQINQLQDEVATKNNQVEGLMRQLEVSNLPTCLPSHKRYTLISLQQKFNWKTARLSQQTPQQTFQQVSNSLLSLEIY